MIDTIFVLINAALALLFLGVFIRRQMVPLVVDAMREQEAHKQKYADDIALLQAELAQKDREIAQERGRSQQLDEKFRAWREHERAHLAQQADERAALLTKSHEMRTLRQHEYERLILERLVKNRAWYRAEADLCALMSDQHRAQAFMKKAVGALESEVRHE